MTNLNRLILQLNNKPYFANEVYEQLLDENGLDPLAHYEAENDKIALLSTVYSILQMLANDIDAYCKIETEFITKSAAYAQLQKRLTDLKKEIENAKEENGSQDTITGYMFFNGR